MPRDDLGMYVSPAPDGRGASDVHATRRMRPNRRIVLVALSLLGLNYLHVALLAPAPNEPCGSRTAQSSSTRCAPETSSAYRRGRHHRLPLPQGGSVSAQ